MAETTICISTDSDIVLARQSGREMAATCGFSRTQQTMLATAISEVARNILTYARVGEICLATVYSRGRQGISIVARDQGPGIADKEMALRDGFSTTRSLGLGLPGARRIVDEFDLESVVGVGTVVSMVKWL